MSDDLRVPKFRIVEAACRDDFLSFFQWSFHFLEPATPLHLNWHHFAVAHHLELVLRGKITRLIIAGAPRTLKSMMSSVVLPCYILGRNRPRGSSGSATAPFCRSTSTINAGLLSRRRIIRNSLLRTRLSKSTETEFHTTLGGYRYAKSAEGSLTGLGGDILILDDFQKPLDMHSEARRDSTANIFYSTVASRINNQHTGAIVVVGQRLHPDDLISRLLPSEENWTELCLPAIAEKEERIRLDTAVTICVASAIFFIRSNSRSRCSRRFALKTRKHIGRNISKVPSPYGGFIIKRDQIQYCDELPRRTSSSTYVQSLDTAQKPGEANSRSACLDILMQDDKYFIAHALANQLDYHELEQLTLLRAEKHRPDVVLIEDTGIGAALISTLKRKNLPVVAVTPEGAKSTPLRHMSKFANGQVFLLKTAPGRAVLEDELFAFPSGRRNDLVDALTQALGYERVRYLWTPKALDNYNRLLFSLAANRPR